MTSALESKTAVQGAEMPTFFGSEKQIPRSKENNLDLANNTVAGFKSDQMQVQAG